MCGRFTLIQLADLADLFPWAGHLCLPDKLAPRYNIAPTQPILALVHSHGQFRLTHMHWGLIPVWEKCVARNTILINARAETLTARKAFAQPFKRRRCLIPADGFYEWQTVGKSKQPYYLQMLGHTPFAMAGLYDYWADDKGNELTTCTIITTQPNDLLRPIHDRMPAIVPPESQKFWLTASEDRQHDLHRLLVPYPADLMMAHRVGLAVNKPQNDTSECIQPADPPQLTLWQG